MHAWFAGKPNAVILLPPETPQVQSSPLNTAGRLSLLKPRCADERRLTGGQPAQQARRRFRRRDTRSVGRSRAQADGFQAPGPGQLVLAPGNVTFRSVAKPRPQRGFVVLGVCFLADFKVYFSSAEMFLFSWSLKERLSPEWWARLWQFGHRATTFCRISCPPSDKGTI